MLFRLCVAGAILLAGLVPARAEKPAASSSSVQDLEKVNNDCRTILGSTVADSAMKDQAHQWVDATKLRSWGSTTGRFLGMGKSDNGAWWVRLQPKQGTAVVLPYDKLDAEGQQRLKDLWNLQYYIPRNAEKVRTDLTQLRGSVAKKPAVAAKATKASYTSSTSAGGSGATQASQNSSGSQPPGKCDCGR